MKKSKLLLLLSAFAILTSCSRITEGLVDAVSGASKGLTANGNSLFHQSDETSMRPGRIRIAGEVKQEGEVKLRKHYKHEAVYKEVVMSDEGLQFIGAYRYRGYSLFDLLHPFLLEKKNAEEFKPSIDLYVVIENDKDEFVVFSWSEIFHTADPHKILIATEVAPIRPYRGESNYPLPGIWRVVATNDFIAWRTLDNPVKISIRSFDRKEYAIDRDLTDVYSDGVDIYEGSKLLGRITDQDGLNAETSYRSHFFGMGMGYHQTQVFKGPDLKSLVLPYFDELAGYWMRHGLVCMSGIDGYRAVFSFGELFNRADGIEPLLAVVPDKGGHFRAFLPSDFFADRSVKSLKEMFFFSGL